MQSQQLKGLLSHTDSLSQQSDIADNSSGGRPLQLTLLLLRQQQNSSFLPNFLCSLFCVGKGPACATYRGSILGAIASHFSPRFKAQSSIVFYRGNKAIKDRATVFVMLLRHKQKTTSLQFLHKSKGFFVPVFSLFPLFSLFSWLSQIEAYYVHRMVMNSSIEGQKVYRHKVLCCVKMRPVFQSLFTFRGHSSST